jgi:hypothetical protein
LTDVTIRTSWIGLLATFGLQAKHELLHRDHDFDGFEKRLGLKVVRVCERATSQEGIVVERRSS